MRTRQFSDGFLGRQVILDSFEYVVKCTMEISLVRWGKHLLQDPQEAQRKVVPGFECDLSPCGKYPCDCISDCIVRGWRSVLRTARRFEGNGSLTHLNDFFDVLASIDVVNDPSGSQALALRARYYDILNKWMELCRTLQITEKFPNSILRKVHSTFGVGSDHDEEEEECMFPVRQILQSV